MAEAPPLPSGPLNRLDERLVNRRLLENFDPGICRDSVDEPPIDRLR